MAQPVRRIDVSDKPDLLQVAEQVQSTGAPAVLVRGGEDLALLSPAPRKRRPPSKARPVTQDDPLFKLIGIGRGKTPGGVSSDKHTALARARSDH
jgi:hypothetical protein